MCKYCKILVVDDEFIMRQGIKHMIDWEQDGFEVIGEASNCQEALEMIKINVPHIIISDVVMPQMDGIEFTKIVQAKYPQIKIVILSSYSDFEYVRSSFQNGAVDYILKPSLNPANLLETLKKISCKIQDLELSSKGAVNIQNILNRLILGFDSNINFDYLNKLFIHSRFCLFGINLKKIYTDDQERQKLINLFTSEIDSQDFKDEVTEIIHVNSQTIILLVNFDSKNYRSLLSKLNNICNIVSSNFSKAFFVLSKEFRSIQNIKSIYENDFLILTQQYFYNKNIHFLSSKDFETHASIEKFNFKLFSESVFILKISEAFGMLTEYIEMAINNKSLTEFELKTLIENSFYNVISTLEYLKFDVQVSNDLKYECFNKIDKSEYSEDLMLTYKSLVSYFKEIIETHTSNINSHMINKIVQYIHTHYDEQLTLSNVSKLFNFNYYYLSSYFSSYNKEGFNEFLNKIRIEKACEFLKQDIPISDISSLVGYSDHSYFCKVFKKFIGLTPSNFRKKQH